MRRQQHIELVNLLRSARTNATIEFLECLNSGNVNFYFPYRKLINQINSYRAMKICKLLNIKLGKSASLHFSNIKTFIDCSDVMEFVEQYRDELISFHNEITKYHELNAKHVFKTEVDNPTSYLEKLMNDEPMVDKTDLSNYRRFMIKK